MARIQQLEIAINKTYIRSQQMPKQIKITSISATFNVETQAVSQKQLSVSFQIAQQVEKTSHISYNGTEINWTENITLSFADQDSLKITLSDKNTPQNSSIATVSLSLESLAKQGKHSVPFVAQNKQPIGSVAFHYSTIVSTEQVKQASITPISQTNIKNQQPTLKIDQSAQNKIETKVAQNKKEPNLQTSPKIQQTPIQSQKSIDKKPSKKDIQKHEQPKPTQPKISDKVGKKLTEKSQVKPSEKTIEIQRPQKVNLETHNPHDVSIIGSKSLNKSQNEFKLPNIGDASKNFGDRIYDKQSSATLQKSILVFSMPKAQRFGSGPKYAGEPSYYVDSCFKPNATKGVGFGFGNKKQFPEWLQKNMKENPAPGAYFQEGKASTHLRSRGPTFGISHKFYEKVTIPKQKSPQKATISNQRLKPIFRLK